MNNIATPSPHPTCLRQELRNLLTLALPIMVGQMAYTSMGFVDAVMAGSVGPLDLAAVALGNAIWIPVYLLMTGILTATMPKVAKRYGAGQTAEIGPLVRQALWLALVVGLIAAGLLLNAEQLLILMDVSPQLIQPSMQYLQGIAAGFPATALFYVLCCFSDGLGRTRPNMVLGLCGLALNVPFNYIFIYGHFGVPAMGGIGCGWTTAIVTWLLLLGMTAWTCRAAVYQPYTLFARLEYPKWSEIKHLISIGLPIGIAIFAQASIYAVIALLIATLGANVVASHQIALNFSSLLFMIPYSLGTAITVCVGQALGSGEPRRASVVAKVGIAAALGYALLSASGIWLLRHKIPLMYTTDPAVIELAAALLLFAAVYQFSEGAQITAAAALRGYQDTQAPMVMTLLACWGIGLPIGYTLGLTEWFGPQSGPIGLWQGLIVGLTCSALMLGCRLTWTSRQHIRRAL